MTGGGREGQRDLFPAAYQLDMIRHWVNSETFAQYPWVRDLLAAYDAEHRRAEAADLAVAELRSRLDAWFCATDGWDTLSISSEPEAMALYALLARPAPERAMALLEAGTTLMRLVNVWGALTESDIEAMERVPEDIRDAEYIEDLQAMESRLTELTNAVAAWRALVAGQGGEGRAA